MNDRNNYRIIRLVSGEFLIAELCSKTRSTIEIYRPFEMKTVEFTTDNGMVTGEAMVMKSWQLLAKNSMSKISRSHVISIDEPRENVIAVYEIEKRKEDDPLFREQHKSKMVDKLADLMEDDEVEDIEDDTDPFAASFEPLDEPPAKEDPLGGLNELLNKLQNLTNMANMVNKNKKTSVDNPQKDATLDHRNDAECDSDKDMFGW